MDYLLCAYMLASGNIVPNGYRKSLYIRALMKIQCIKHSFQIGLHYVPNNNSEMILKVNGKAKLFLREQLALFIYSKVRMASVYWSNGRRARMSWSWDIKTMTKKRSRYSGRGSSRVEDGVWVLL